MSTIAVKNSDRLDAVVFDLDGLLIDTERLSVAGWMFAAQSLGHTLAESVCIQMMGSTELDADVMLREELGASFDIVELRRLWRTYVKEILEGEGVKKLDGVDPLLDFLVESKIRHALATSSSAVMAELKLRVTNLNGRFEVIVTGDQIFRGKPEPDIFIEAARQLGVKCERRLALEDSDQGIMAAKRAGMRPIMIPGLKQPSAEIVDLAEAVFPSLKSVIPYIKDLVK